MQFRALMMLVPALAVLFASTPTAVFADKPDGKPAEQQEKPQGGHEKLEADEIIEIKRGE